MFETVMIQNATLVSASMNGVAARRTAIRKTKRERLAASATTRTIGRWASRYAEIGDSRFPMNGAATTIATSVVDPPIRRTTTGMNAMRTETNAPAPRALKRSIRKLRRTREGSQFGSVTARKLTAAAALCHRPTGLGATFGTRSIAAARTRSVTASRTVAPAARAGRPRPEATPARPALAERATGARRRRADHHAAVRLHADGLGLQTLLSLHRQVHDAPLIGEHRLERDGLPARAHPRSNALRDLAELVLPATSIAFDVDRDVNGAADALRRDRAHDLLQRDEVLAAAPDERAEIGAEHVDALQPRAILERHLGLDTHRAQQLAQHGRAQRELLRECG